MFHLLADRPTERILCEERSFASPPRVRDSGLAGAGTFHLANLEPRSRFAAQCDVRQLVCSSLTNTRDKLAIVPYLREFIDNLWWKEDRERQSSGYPDRGSG